MEKTRISADKTTIHDDDFESDYEDSDSDESDYESDYDTDYTDDDDYDEQTSDSLEYDESKHVLTGVNYTECALCKTQFIEYGGIYCKEGCPTKALERLDDNLQPVASETAVKECNT